MPADSDQLGYAAIDLLAGAWIVPVIRELTVGPLRPVQIERTLGVSHSLTIERLEELLLRGLVSRERAGGVRPAAHYALSDAGRALLDVLEVAARWERRWSQHQDGRAVPGVWALRVLGDRHNRAIILALAREEPLRAGELQARLHGLGRSATAQRLRDLSQGAILAREHHEGTVLYSLTPGARRLGLVVMLAARWEWQHPPADSDPSAGDLAGLLRLLAPVTQVSGGVGGTCRLHVDSERSTEPDVYLDAHDSRVTVLADAPSAPPNAVGHATPEAWCDTLLGRSLRGVSTTGNALLLIAVLASISDALFT